MFCKALVGVTGQTWAGAPNADVEAAPKAPAAAAVENANAMARDALSERINERISQKHEVFVVCQVGLTCGASGIHACARVRPLVASVVFGLYRERECSVS